MKSISLTGGEGGYFEQGFNVTIPKNLVNSIRVRYVSFPRMNEEASGSKKVHRMRNFWVGPSICIVAKADKVLTCAISFCLYIY